MGIWDCISSTTDYIKRNVPDSTSVKGVYWSSYDSIKRNAPDPTSVMGFYCSSFDSFKRNAPDPTSVKGCYWSSYDYSRAAVKRIHDAVRVNTVDKVYPYLSDVETLSEVATNVAKKTVIVVIREGAKSIPGGPTVYDIFIRSIPWEKKPKESKDVKEFKDKVRQMETEQDRMKHELNDYKRLLEQHEMRRLIMELKTNKTLGWNREPKDVIRFFMKPEVTGQQDLKPEVTGKQDLPWMI